MKTGLCQFSGFKIHPGHGVKYVRLDSKSFTFVDGKSESLFLHKRNPRKIRWTQVYRRMHKKGTSAEELAKKKARRPQKLQRAIVGASLEVLKQKRNQKPEVRSAQREAALREIKDRKKKQKEAKAANKAAAAKADKKAQPSKSKATTGKDKGRK